MEWYWYTLEEEGISGQEEVLIFFHIFKFKDSQDAILNSRENLLLLGWAFLILMHLMFACIWQPNEEALNENCGSADVMSTAEQSPHHCSAPIHVRQQKTPNGTSFIDESMMLLFALLALLINLF